MPSKQGSFKQDLTFKRIRFQRQFLPRLFRGDRVAIGFVGHLAVAIEVGLARDAACKRPRWQWTQVRLFFLPGLSNTDRLAMDHPHIVASAGGQQVAIEFLKGGHARHGHEKISPTKPHRLCRPLTTDLFTSSLYLTGQGRCIVQKADVFRPAFGYTLSTSTKNNEIV